MLFTGPTLTSTVKQALKKFKLKPLDLNKISMTVVQKPNHGFLGFGRKPAKAKIVKKVEKKSKTKKDDKQISNK